MIYILIFLLSFFNATMFHYLGQNPSFYQLGPYTSESEGFRSLKLGQTVADLDRLDCGQIAALMIEHDFDLTDCKDLSCDNRMLLLQKPADYRKLTNAYAAILQDLRYFPVPDSIREGTQKVVYGDSFNEPRTYGGDRKHEGCDIMGNQRERGFYPVVSMSDGVVEKVGWLEKGGWRIGIRSPSGAYLYYAHLYSYSQAFKEGDQVKAGELIGYMGDSGYGKAEDTVGNFEVHLHLGIYIRTDHHEELSVDPYWVLKYLEKYKLRYDY